MGDHCLVSVVSIKQVSRPIKLVGKGRREHSGTHRGRRPTTGRDACAGQPEDSWCRRRCNHHCVSETMKRIWMICSNCLTPNPEQAVQCTGCRASLPEGTGGAVAFDDRAREMIGQMGGINTILPTGTGAVVVWCEAGVFLYSSDSVRWERFTGFVDDVVLGKSDVEIHSGGSIERVSLYP